MVVPPVGNARPAAAVAVSTVKDATDCTDSTISDSSTGVRVHQAAEYVPEADFSKHTQFVLQTIETLTLRMDALEKLAEGTIPNAVDKSRTAVQELLVRFESTEAETAIWLRKLDDTAANLTATLDAATKRWRDETHQLWEAVDSHTHDVNVNNVDDDDDDLQTMPAAVFRGKPTDCEEIEASEEVLLDIAEVIGPSSAIIRSDDPSASRAELLSSPGGDSQMTSFVEETASTSGQKKVQWIVSGRTGHWTKDGDVSPSAPLSALRSSHSNPTLRLMPPQAVPVAPMAVTHASASPTRQQVHGTGAMSIPVTPSMSIPVTPLVKPRGSPATYTRTCSSAGSPPVPNYIPGTVTKTQVPRASSLKRAGSSEARVQPSSPLVQTARGLHSSDNPILHASSTGSLTKIIANYSPRTSLKMNQRSPRSPANTSRGRATNGFLTGFISPRVSANSSKSAVSSPPAAAAVVTPAARILRQSSCPDSEDSKKHTSSTGRLVVIATGGGSGTLPVGGACSSAALPIASPLGSVSVPGYTDDRSPLCHSTVTVGAPCTVSLASAEMPKSRGASPIRTAGGASCIAVIGSTDLPKSRGTSPIRRTGGGSLTLPNYARKADVNVQRGLSPTRANGGGSLTLPRAKPMMFLEHYGGAGASGSPPPPAKFRRGGSATSPLPNGKVDVNSPTTTVQSPAQIVRSAPRTPATILRQTSGTDLTPTIMAASSPPAASPGPLVATTDARSQDTNGLRGGASLSASVSNKVVEPPGSATIDASPNVPKFSVTPPYIVVGLAAQGQTLRRSYPNMKSSQAIVAAAARAHESAGFLSASVSTAQSPRLSPGRKTPVFIAQGAVDVNSARGRGPPQSNQVVAAPTKVAPSRVIRQNSSPVMGYRATTALGPVQLPSDEPASEEGQRLKWSV